MTKLYEMSYDELTEHAEKVIEQLRRKAFGEGYEQGKFDQRMETAFDEVAKITRGTGITHEKTAQERRDEIVERAKADVEDLAERMISEFPAGEGNYVFRKRSTVAEFVVNKDKQTVVAIVKGSRHPAIYERGIAKCAPNDCFNVHIGKAIALRRALGKRVPDEYLNAPQPAEARVGDVVEVTLDYGGKEIKPVEIVNKDAEYNVHLPGRIIRHPSNYAKIIDDSREEDE